MTDRYPKQYLYRRVVRAKLFIDQNYSRPIDLSAVAGEACFSKFHFTRLFKQMYGHTPHQYLTAVRIEKAKQMLAEGCTVARACFSVGFDSVPSLTSLFRRRVGVSPAAFQRQMIARSSEIKTAPAKFIPNCFVEKRGWKK